MVKRDKKGKKHAKKFQKPVVSTIDKIIRNRDNFEWII
jgi:hypothetical protein